VIDSFPDVYRDELEELYQRVRTVWMNYLRGQILLMVIVGVVFTIAWTILGIPGALVLGILAGFFTIIPDVGPFLAAVLAAVVALLEGSSWIPLPHFGVVLIVIAVYLVLIGLKNFWLRPFIMGRSVHMPEALVFIFIIMATVMWGILGALLVIPVMASLAVIFDYLRRRVLGMTPFPPPKEENQPETPTTQPAPRLFQKRGKR
jgi:predicted PurR-regulated permease PerM